MSGYERHVRSGVASLLNNPGTEFSSLRRALRDATRAVAVGSNGGSCNDWLRIIDSALSKRGGSLSSICEMLSIVETPIIIKPHAHGTGVFSSVGSRLNRPLPPVTTRKTGFFTGED